MGCGSTNDSGTYRLPNLFNDMDQDPFSLKMRRNLHSCIYFMFYLYLLEFGHIFDKKPSSECQGHVIDNSFYRF